MSELKEKKEHNHALPVGTLICPKCKERLHFKMMYGIRMVENGMLEAFCPKDNQYFQVKSTLK